MSRPIFSLDDARALLPRVRQLTAEAAIRAEALAEELRRVPEQDPAHGQLSTSLQEIVNGWADEVRALGVEVKGLWLVDFDNGEGYYCWKYPEDTVAHYHGYEEGFAGRISIQ
jgi:hypothetical protein